MDVLVLPGVETQLLRCAVPSQLTTAIHHAIVTNIGLFIVELICRIATFRETELPAHLCSLGVFPPAVAGQIQGSAKTLRKEVRFKSQLSPQYRQGTEVTTGVTVPCL
jgi:hypothetical protein